MLRLIEKDLTRRTQKLLTIHSLENRMGPNLPVTARMGVWLLHDKPFHKVNPNIDTAMYTVINLLMIWPS